MSKHPKTTAQPCPLASRCNGTLRPGECVCVHCRNGLRSDLLALVGPDVALLEELETTRSRQVASSQASGARGKNDPPLPFDLRVGDTLAQLRSHLETAALVVWSAYGGASVHELGTADARSLALYLIEHVDQLQRSEFAPEACARIRAAVGAVRRLVDIRPGRVYLGECGSTVDVEGNEYPPCTAHVFAAEGQQVTRCRLCGAAHDVQGRRQSLAESIDMEATATLWQIAHASAGLFGVEVPISTLNSWARRGKLQPVSTEGRALYRLRDAADLAAHGKVKP